MPVVGEAGRPTRRRNREIRRCRIVEPIDQRLDPGEHAIDQLAWVADIDRAAFAGRFAAAQPPKFERRRRTADTFEAATAEYRAFEGQLRCIPRLNLLWLRHAAGLVIDQQKGASGEAMSWQGWLGVIIVSLAIMSLAAPGRLRHERELSSIGFALATGVTIALYSLADGMGVRRAGNDFSYILWLLAIEGLPLLLVSLWLRRGRIRASFVPALPKGIGGGILAGLGYGIVIWAMGRAPMAHVSALRETSVILAAVIGTALLREPFGLRRIMASGLIVAGSALLHLAG